MERLQLAIEKARAQREGLKTDAAPPAPGAKHPTRDQAADSVADAPSLPQADVGDLWRALPTMEASGLSRNTGVQIVTLRSGPDSMPFDILRTRIIHQAQINGWKRIAVISPHSGCGKTLTVANLAFSFGRQSEMRTLVIDFDLRRATLARTLGQTPTHTMGDVLEGRVPFARHALRHGDNVAFGLNSGPVRNSSELLQSTATRDMLAIIEDEYQPDIVLFDVPPLRATDDSIGILRFVDAAIIIVAAEETPMNQIDVAERQVAELTNVMGIVLNKCRIRDGEYGYDHYGA